MTIDVTASIANEDRQRWRVAPDAAAKAATIAAMDEMKLDRCKGVGFNGTARFWPSAPHFDGSDNVVSEEDQLAAWRENYAWLEDTCGIAMPVDASAPLGLTMTLTALKGYTRNNGVDLTAPEFNVFGSDTFSVTGDVPISFADNAELQAKGTITLDGVDFLASTTWIWTTGLRWNVDINAGQVLIISKAP